MGVRSASAWRQHKNEKRPEKVRTDETRPHGNRHVSGSPRRARPLPLLVHFFFHPGSARTPALAQRLHLALNDDPIVRGLQIPTTYCPHDQDYGPPAAQLLDEAGRNVIVVLADDKLNTYNDWCDFIAQTAEAVAEPSGRLLPIQLDEAAWPMDNRLSDLSFSRTTGIDQEGATSLNISFEIRANRRSP